MQKLLLVMLTGALFSCSSKENKNVEWRVAGGSKAYTRYADINQINKENVHLLQPVWTFNTGDADTVNHSQIQCNPIMVDSVVYGVTPQLKLFAVNAATGKPYWIFNPLDSISGSRRSFFNMNNSRGVTYWTDGKGDQRIFYTAGSFLHCVNAATGKLVITFADSGRLDMHNGFHRDVSDRYISNSSPGIIYKDLIIVGSRVDEGPPAAPGDIRAFNVRTGKMEWIFHTIPHKGEPGHETWDNPEAFMNIGGANNWSGMSMDEERGLLFVPTGSASFDFYGGKRTGNNLYADCLLALDAATGKLKWYFQNIHHDVWDRDIPTPPALVTVTRDGKKIDAVAQPVKAGYLYVLNRETGESLYPIEEVPVPTDTELKGEKLSPTQPRPKAPLPFVRQQFPESELNNLVPDSSFQDIKTRWASFRKDHMYAPPSKQGTIIFPGFDGGPEWGGPAYDPTTDLIYINANEMPWILTMVEKEVAPMKENYAQAGQRLYKQHCMSCHGADRKGTGNFPAIDTISKKYKSEEVHNLINSGRRMMPAFRQLKQVEKDAVVDMLLGSKKNNEKNFPAQVVDSFLSLPYGMTGYHKFLTKEGYPAVKPPWGTLSAINVSTGEYAWKIPLGDYPEFKAKGITTGTENYGGPVVTSGGLLFIAATRDSKIRAFDKLIGKQLWEYALPAPGFATPAVYFYNGKQYLVIACGGGKLGANSSDAYIAFALPD
jgi:quinoprotein glucose dehydrogenase